MINISVNLANVIGRATDIVLHQAAAFHDRYLGDSIANLHAHLVSTDGTTIALSSFATFDDFCVYLWSAQHGSATGP
jgi:hypothetical protein